MTREEWIEQRVQEYTAGLCQDPWHDVDEVQPYWHFCPTCRRKWVRPHQIMSWRAQLEQQANYAEAYATATGWTPPNG